MKRFLGLFGFLAVVAAVVAYFTFFTVHQTQQAMVLEFGNPLYTINSDSDEREAGLHVKVPWRNVVMFDKRILDLDAPTEAVISSDDKYLNVDAFARYRIVNPLQYYKTLTTDARAQSRMSDILNATIKNNMAGSTLRDIITDKRVELMRKISKEVNERVSGFGVKIIDVRIKRADLPPENSKRVFDRMNAERKQEAAEFRAKGEEIARAIRADADKQVTVIKAEATKQAEIIRGEGDAKRNQIFNQAFGKDPDFFAFYRAMQAYEKGLRSGDTRLVLSPNTEFFRYFNDPTGRSGNRK